MLLLMFLFKSKDCLGQHLELYSVSVSDLFTLSESESEMWHPLRFSFDKREQEKEENTWRPLQGLTYGHPLSSVSSEKTRIWTLSPSLYTFKNFFLTKKITPSS